jgi:hypothetical protein
VSQVKYHEHALDELDTSRECLQERLEVLVREEARLVEYLQRLHARAGLGGGDSERGAFSSRDLGRAAALSADLLLSLRAATESSTSRTGAGSREHGRGEAPRRVHSTPSAAPSVGPTSNAALPRPKPKNPKTSKVTGTAAHTLTAVATAGQKLPRSSAPQPPAAAGPKHANAEDEDAIDRQIDELSARIRRRLDAN